MKDTQTDTTYNGWKNYPTWAVNLWLSNDEGLYRQTLDRARYQQNLTGPDLMSAKYRLAIDLQSWVTDELAPDLGATFAADLLAYAFGDVDWFEIAAAWLEDLS